MKDPDVELLKFFHGVIEDEMVLNTVDTHKASLKEVISREEKESITDMTSSSLRCAYLYQYAPSLTSALKRHFRNLLMQNNCFLLQKITQRKKCSICCISTGPANEFVALVKALEDLLTNEYRNADNRMCRLKIEVVVIVPGSQWKGLIRKMVDNLQEFVDIFEWSLDFRFISADLAQSFTDDVKEVISQSDFVTMIHYLSSIHKCGNSLEIIQQPQLKAKKKKKRKIAEMNYLKFQIPENILENFDVDLQTFYHSIFRHELHSPVASKISKIKQALREVVSAYKKDTVDSNASCIFFDSPEKRCAYIMKHCVCFSSAVARHFLQLVRTNPSNLHSAMYNRQVNICCLGGGPGTEAVAIAKVLNAFNNAVFFFRRQKLRLKVQVVDLSKDWETTGESVLKMVNITPKLCDSDRMEISFAHLEADLTEPFDEQVRKALGEADIITMVYFVSAVNGSKAQGKCASMLKNILNFAKQESLLFFLDSAKTLHYHAVNCVVSQHEQFRLIYGPIDQEFHTLSPKSVKKFIKLYYAQFNALLCLTNCFVTSAGWTKGRRTSTPLGIISDTCVQSCRYCFGNARRKKVGQRMEDVNTKKQERFREWVRRLLLSEVKPDFVTSDRKELDGYEEMLEVCVPCKFKTLCAAKSKQRRLILVRL